MCSVKAGLRALSPSTLPRSGQVSPLRSLYVPSQLCHCLMGLSLSHGLCAIGGRGSGALLTLSPWSLAEDSKSGDSKSLNKYLLNESINNEHTNRGFASLQSPTLGPHSTSSVNICYPVSLPGSLARPSSRGTALFVCPSPHSRVILAWNSGH